MGVDVAPTRNLSVVLEGKGPVTLRPSDHIATGGQGSVYKVAGKAVKLYLRPAEALASGLPDKIRLLSRLSHPFVNAPEGLVVDSHASPIGHYLPFIDNGHALSLVFTNDFWNKEGFGVQQASTLADRMRTVFEFAHSHDALLIDANELNWFALLPAVEPRVIDVDSWSLDRWKAEVIMPSIRDWHSKTFDRSTDWFAWGVVTFQLYTGIHPYKGTLDGFGRADMLGRMKANASVFSKGVRLNLAVRDFSLIPSHLRSWYEDTFQHGHRSIPPSPLAQAVPTASAAKQLHIRIVTTTTGSTLRLEKILDAKHGHGTVVKIFPCGVALTSTSRLIDLVSKSVIGRGTKNCEVVEVPGGWVMADLALPLTYIPRANPLDARSIPFTTFITYLVRSDNRLFAANESGLTELKIQVMDPTHVLASAGNTWGILGNSTRWFDGVGVQDALGAMFLLAPFGPESLGQTRVRELDGLKVVTGRSGNRFVSLVAVDRAGDYHKFELTFSRDYSSYSVWQAAADTADLNLAILPKGVCATIYQDGELVIFVPSTGTVKKVEDKQVGTDMQLANWRDAVVAIQGGEVWSVKAS